MDMDLYYLCNEYCTCFRTVNLLIEVKGVDSERLQLFRLMLNKMKQLEQEIGACIVEIDLKNNKK